MMRASVWIAQLGAMRPDTLTACHTAFGARSKDRDFLPVGAEAFAACPADSIDYAVMEKLPVGLGVVIPLAAGWSDVGAWDALWQIGSKDGNGNVLRGDVMAVNTRDTLAISQSRMVACVGLTDTVVVETPDAVLVAHKSDLQQIKQVVERLKPKNVRRRMRIARSIGRRATTTASKPAPDSRVSESSSTREPLSHCRCIIIAPSTGSWSRVRARESWRRKHSSLGK